MQQQDISNILILQFIMITTRTRLREERIPPKIPFFGNLTDYTDCLRKTVNAEEEEDEDRERKKSLFWTEKENPRDVGACMVLHMVPPARMCLLLLSNKAFTMDILHHM